MGINLRRPSKNDIVTIADKCFKQALEKKIVVNDLVTDEDMIVDLLKAMSIKHNVDLEELATLVINKITSNKEKPKRKAHVHTSNRRVKLQYADLVDSKPQTFYDNSNIVYVLHGTCNGDRIIKVGSTSNWKQRLNQINQSFPCFSIDLSKSRLIKVKPFVDKDFIEEQFHLALTQDHFPMHDGIGSTEFYYYNEDTDNKFKDSLETMYGLFNEQNGELIFRTPAQMNFRFDSTSSVSVAEKILW